MKSGLAAAVNALGRRRLGLMDTVKNADCVSLVNSACATNAALTAVCTCFKIRVVNKCSEQLGRRLQMEAYLKKLHAETE